MTTTTLLRRSLATCGFATCGFAPCPFSAACDAKGDRDERADAAEAIAADLDVEPAAAPR